MKQGITKKVVAVFVSGHGLGHINQMRPFLKLLFKEAKVLLFTNIDKAYVERSEITYDKFWTFSEVGLVSEQPVMQNSLEVDLSKTQHKLQLYKQSLKFSKKKLENIFRSEDVYGVVSNIDALPLHVAQNLKMPNFAFCSLDWYSVYSQIRQNTMLNDFNRLFSFFKKTYQNVNVFFRPSPYVKVDWLTHEYEIAPQFVAGKQVRVEIDMLFKTKTKNKKLVLVNFGGVEQQIVLPNVDNVVWITNLGDSDRMDLIRLHQLKKYFCFEDIAVSVDLLVTKPGYGTFVLAASTHLPIISLERTNWPDVPSLEAWVAKYCNLVKVSEDNVYNALSNVDSFITNKKQFFRDDISTEDVSVVVNKVLS